MKYFSFSVLRFDGWTAQKGRRITQYVFMMFLFLCVKHALLRPVGDRWITCGGHKGIFIHVWCVDEQMRGEKRREIQN